ncbi:hypothetical protein [Amycolatopsis rifamycinica]|uniref:Uncharacterized protein n=1 Tax=Amycolatopsis rifamycinica TaxID=287986 RepID=A0A066TXW5_9PSEU|nr:hypothetical protein [Amycolatopsis rifamycinica]KDN18437.1 hypothetical protein DV20_30110 [Amycolatopsis rifamycinica]
MAVTAPPKPRAGTAVAAGVLAVLGGLWFLTGIFWWTVVFGFGPLDLLVPGQIADAVIGLLLLLGGSTLLARVEAGRVLCLAAGGLALVALIVASVLRFQRILFVVGGPTGIGEPVLRGLVTAAPFVALLVLAARPATRRWMRR